MIFYQWSNMCNVNEKCFWLRSKWRAIYTLIWMCMYILQMKFDLIILTFKISMRSTFRK
jgi:hypothetical protein